MLNTEVKWMCLAMVLMVMYLHFYTDVIYSVECIALAADGWIHEFERFVPE